MESMAFVGEPSLKVKQGSETWNFGLKMKESIVSNSMKLFQISVKTKLLTFKKS